MNETESIKICGLNIDIIVLPAFDGETVQAKIRELGLVINENGKNYTEARAKAIAHVRDRLRKLGYNS